MIARRLSFGLTAVNLLLLAFLLMGSGRAPQPLGVLRGTGLEIVDARGRPRATISLHQDTVIDGKRYPETVLLRLIDPARRPLVKLEANTSGSALGLSDDEDGGVMLMARDTAAFVRVVSRSGETRVVRP